MATITRDDERAMEASGVDRAEFTRARDAEEQESRRRAGATLPETTDVDGLTASDNAAMLQCNVSREDFIAARRQELTMKATRPDQPTPAPAKKPRFAPPPEPYR